MKKISTAVAQEIENPLTPPTLSERRFFANYPLEPPTNRIAFIDLPSHHAYHCAIP
jgi:hypothetical protein